jgi:hypothetical protein
MTDQLDSDARAPRADPAFVLRFQDNREPAVPAGRFRIQVSQSLPVPDADQPPERYLTDAEEFFEVRAPQFALDDERLHAVNPSPDSTADYSGTLAHVTLADPLLPWMRHLAESTRTAPAVPWLALLLFAEGELPGDPESAGLTRTMTAGELTADAPGVRHPGIALSQIEGDPTALCETVDIPGDVFQTVVPRTDELRLLLHVREVRTDTGLRGEQLAEGQFAVVVANRLPDRSQPLRYAAHLVSLEGCASILADADAGLLTGAESVRLAALHSWSFSSVPAEGGGFTGRVRNFLFDEREQPRDLPLRMPEPPPTAPPGADPAAYATARGRLLAGRLPLAYRVESGEQTYAWYRGPLTAEPAQPLPPTPAAGWTSAAQLLVYEQAWGVFDASWAAAWALGRALALADADFTATLTAWHARARSRAAAMAQRLAAPGLGADPLALDAGALDAGSPEAGALDVGVLAARQARALEPRPFGRMLEGLVADGSAARVLRAATDPVQSRTAATPPAPPTRRPRVSGRRGEGRAARTAGLLSDPPSAMRAALTAQLSEAAQPVVAWLDRLRLLVGVPFADLVPDERMLPAESLRVFHVDPGWLTALQAGATGIAITGELDADLARTAAPWAARARGEDDGDTAGAGVLIRSALVHEVPGLLVRPYRGTGAARAPIRVLRQAELGPDVLLVLFDQVPDEIELAEPPEGLSFGIDTAPGGVRVVDLRGLTAPVAEEIHGASFPDPVGGDGLEAYLRADPAGRPAVLDLRPDDPSGLLRALGERLAGLGQGEAATFGPAALAVQLVNAPRRQLITRGTTS